MIRQFRVVVYKCHRKWCSIDIESPWSSEVLIDIKSIFNLDSGFDLKIFEADDECRIYISGPEGIKLLSREVLFKPVTTNN